MKYCLALSGIATFFLINAVKAADSIEFRDASYFCVAEAAGGLTYNEGQKKWTGTPFKPSEKFVLRMKYIKSETGKDTWDKDDTYAVFLVTVTPAGKNKPMGCVPSGNSGTVSVSKYGGFSCTGWNLQDYKFNIVSNRFLSIYAVGFINGSDNNEDTPSVSGGTCTKID